MNILAHMDKTRLFLIIRKPGKVAKVDTDHDPGPEARLLTHIPPSSAHPHLDRYLGGHSVFSSSSSFSLTTTFRSLCGRSLKILSRTSAGNVLLMHPAAILASHF